jgi:beta-phosphoglucomutase
VTSLLKSHAFIFDMDGVIVDSNPYHRIALKQFCEKYGYHLTEEELLKNIYGRTNKEWITNLFGKLPASKLGEYEEEKESLFRRIYENDIRPLPGLISFLKELDRLSIPRAIGTSAPRSNVDFVLSRTGLTPYFKVILDESDVVHGKPNPEIYLKVAAALNMAPDQCIVLEDSISGISAGKTAGSKVIGVATTHTKEELETALVIKDFQGLKPESLIESLFK